VPEAMACEHAPLQEETEDGNRAMVPL